MLLTVVREKILKVLLDIYPILSHIRNVNCIQGVTQNKQVAVVVHKVKVSQTLYTGKNERIDMDRERSRLLQRRNEIVMKQKSAPNN
jgi:hypothetical protein